MTTYDLIREFLMTYQNHNTRERYGRAVQLFLNWYRDDAETATPVDLLEYLDKLPWAATTKHLQATAIRQFYTYHYGRQHPINDVVVPKGHARRGRSLNWQEVDALLAIHDSDTAIGTRNIAMIRLMVDSGLRCHEICTLKHSNVELDKMRAEVHGKGDTWETVVFSPVTRDAIRRWLVFRKSIIRCTCLFCSLSMAKIYRGTPLTNNGLKTIFKTWSQAVGFRVSPHDLRRTMAVLLCEANANTRAIQLQGRWKNLKEVERYTQNLQLNQIRAFLPSQVHQRMD